MIWSDEKHQEVLGLLSELICIVQQITFCGDDDWKGLDRLIEEMDSRMGALQDVLPKDGGLHYLGDRAVSLEAIEGHPHPSIVSKMRELASKIRGCMHLLSRRMIEVEEELTSTRQSQRAVHAYGSKN